MKLQRLIAIITILLQQDRISATALAKKFGVSVRTIYRDMQALEQAGIPIVTHTGANGGFAIVEQYKIDKKLFTHQDIAMLLTSLNSISSTMSEARVNLTLEKIKGLIPREYGQSIELSSKKLHIDLTPWAANPMITEHIQQIQQALEMNQLLQFHYINQRAISSSRTVEPHQLVLKENNWYLRAWCQGRQSFRTFRITRIRNLQMLSETFKPRDFENTLDDYMVWSREENVYVDLIIDPSMREQMLDFCPEEYLADLEDGRIKVHMPFLGTDYAYGIVLGMGHLCEVVGPPKIRAEVIRRIEQMRSVYAKECNQP